MTTSKLYEPEMIINPNTRKIFIPKELYNICVTTDDNSEIVKIRIPRIFDGFDFSTKECTITYNNALKERGIYEVSEIEAFDDSLLLSWCISNHVTKKTGKIYFVVEFKTSNAEHKRTYSWSTIPAELNVLPWLDDNVKYTDDIDGDKVVNHLLLCSHKHHNMAILNQITLPMIEQIKNLTSFICNGLHVPPRGRVGQVLGRIPQEDMQRDPAYTWVDLPEYNNIELPENVSAFYNDAKYQTKNDVLNTISGKVDKVAGMGLSTNDYSNIEKQKLLNTPNIIFSTAIPSTLEPNTVCFVYEE